MPCTPTLVGPVSALLKSVRVTGALPGAVVTVSSIGTNPRDVARGVAAGGDDRIPLLAGETLRGDDRLVARQVSDGQASSPTPAGLALGVQPAPANASEIGAVAFRSHLYACGQHLWIVGAIPGAIVLVVFLRTVHGRAQALEDGARIALGAPLPRDEDVAALQVTPVGVGAGPSVTPDPTPVQRAASPVPAGTFIPRAGDLPVPVIQPPAFGCQTAVLVTGVVDGATVALRHASGAVDTAGFDMPALWMRLPPLRAGDTLAPRQALPACKLSSFDGAPVRVEPARPTAPQVAAPCAGAPFVRVAGLLPGAIVRIRVGAKEHMGMAPPHRPEHAFGVDPLPRSGTVVVTQELCGIRSPATIVPISAHADVTRAVAIVQPLLSCAQAVSVTGAHDGALLQVVSTNPQTGAEAPISGFVVAHGTQATIPVAPLLTEGHAVTVRQWACSTTPTSPPAVGVQPHGMPFGPRPLGPVPGATVHVAGALPGAWVEVEVAVGEVWTFAGAAIASADSFDVGLTRQLRVGDLVRARQTLCGERSRPGPVARVLRPLPQPPVLDQPPKDAAGVALQTTFRWHDPAPIGDGKADSFTITLRKGAAVVVTGDGLPTGSFQAALEPRTSYTWAVVARNTTGASAQVMRSFTTGAAPPPPRPQLDGYDVATKTLSGHGFTPNHDVSLRLTMFGSALISAYGQSVADTRDSRIGAKSDRDGKVRAVVDPRVILPWLRLSDIDPPLIGVWRGEVMRFTATDGRPDAGSLDGFLWSDVLVKPVP